MKFFVEVDEECFPLRWVAAVRQSLQLPLQPLHHLEKSKANLIAIVMLVVPQEWLISTVAHCKLCIPRQAHLYFDFIDNIDTIYKIYEIYQI